MVKTAVIFNLIFFLFKLLITFFKNFPDVFMTGTLTNILFDHLLIIIACLIISSSLSANTSTDTGIFFVIFRIFKQ